MAKPERIEDLGRLRELLDQISEHELFSWKDRTVRDKDAEEWFLKLSDEEKGNKIHSLAYNISYVEEKISEAYLIARWGEDNETD